VTTTPSSGATISPEPASPSPAGAIATQQPGLAWRYADINQPSAVITAPSLDPSYQCHPCHYLAENDLLAVGKWSHGLIAVGQQKPPPEPMVLTSTDGLSWDQVDGLTARDTSTTNAVASAGDRTVIVGSEHSGATAWAYDGQSWTQAPEAPALAVPYAAGGMTAVTSLNGEFIAGGYRDDPLHNTASAAAWRSADGLTWQLDDAGQVFANGRIWSMAHSTDMIVAVGTNGDPIYGPAAAWYWTAASGWQRAQIGPDDGGAMAAVTAGPNGFVAVGKNGTDIGASVWTSTDGHAWKRIADQPSLHYYQLALRMQSIAAGPNGFLAGGWRSDVAKGSAVIWRSADALTWSDPEWQTTFSGGQVTGVALTENEAIAVGRTGYPDWNQATIWVRNLPF
jgi:hypothetical protein